MILKADVLVRAIEAVKPDADTPVIFSVAAGPRADAPSGG